MRVQARRARLRDERRASIEAAAIELFLNRGVEGTTVDLIAARADVAKGTFFNYFDTKHDVLASRFRRLSVEFLSFCEDDRSSAPLDRLESFFSKAEALFRREEPGLLLLYNEVLARPDLISIDEEVESQIRAYYESIFRAGKNTRSISENVHISVAAEIVGDIWSSTLRNWMAEVGGFSLAETMSLKLRQIFRGWCVGGK